MGFFHARHARRGHLRGSITAILVGTPGTAAAAATLLEGPKLTARNVAQALEMATLPRFRGIPGAVALVTCAPLATAAMSFGPAEYFALAVRAHGGGDLSSGAMCKGLPPLWAFSFSTVDDPVFRRFRNTFDVPELFSSSR